MIRVRTLHALAWVAMRTLPFKRAKRAVDAAARLFVPPPPDDSTRARMAAALDGRGTCLSRSMTLAACVPDAELVLGADPAKPRHRGVWTAHAWVEHRGRPLREADASGVVIARFR